jgi:hypothetical protein
LGRFQPILTFAVTLLLSWLLLGCSESATEGPSSAACGELPYFTVMPVALQDFSALTVIGGLGAPGHTLPTAHSGFYLSREGAPIRSPGEIQVRAIRRTVYRVSPTRQGEADYALNFGICRDVEGWFGHLTSLPPALLDGANWQDCRTYSTATETVESCVSTTRTTLAAGDPMGTGGLSIALGLMGLDFGLLDSRVNHFHAAPWRHPAPTFHAVCGYEYFDAATRSALFSRLRDPARPHVTPTGEPRCGTMAVDVVGTAKGIWADPAVTTPVAGDETRYITLADYPYRPQQELALSLGPAELGARVAVVPRATTGRVNRAFEHVAADGSIYCYTNEGEPQQAGRSWLLSLSAAGRLRIEQVHHPAGASPCANEPATWSFGAAAVELVR